MSHPNRERGDRILDAAGELLLRMGYRKVAVDDIARAAGIGKGTVYLHWRTKELLFQALMMRESADLTEVILDGIKADPAMILPHRMISSSFLATHRRPLVMAMMRGNAELFGSLGDLALRKQQQELSGHFEDAMRLHGLVRTDVPNLDYALNATSIGFYLTDVVSAKFEGIPIEERVRRPRAHDPRRVRAARGTRSRGGREGGRGAHSGARGARLGLPAGDLRTRSHRGSRLIPGPQREKGRT